MNFENVNSDVKFFKNKEYSEDARLNWNKLCKNILSNENTELRKLLMSINPTIYCKKNISLTYYLNKFMKYSEKEKNSELALLQSFDSTQNGFNSCDLMADGIDIMKKLFIDSIQTKQDKFSKEKKFQSTLIPKIDSLSVSETTVPHLKPLKNNRKISWKNAETIISHS